MNSWVIPCNIKVFDVAKRYCETDGVVWEKREQDDERRR